MDSKKIMVVDDGDRLGLASIYALLASQGLAPIVYKPTQAVAKPERHQGKREIERRRKRIERGEKNGEE